MESHGGVWIAQQADLANQAYTGRSEQPGNDPKPTVRVFQHRGGTTSRRSSHIHRLQRHHFLRVQSVAWFRLVRDIADEIKRRINRGHRNYYSLLEIFKSKSVSRKTKL